MRPMQKISIDTKIGLVICISFVSALLFIVPSQIEEEVGHHYQSPSLYPKILIGVMILLSMLMTATSLRKRTAITNKSGLKSARLLSSQNIRVFVMIVASIAYIWIVVDWLGFLLSSAIILLFSMRFYGYRNTFVTILIAVIVPIVVYYIFKVSLQMPLPMGSIFE